MCIASTNPYNRTNTIVLQFDEITILVAEEAASQSQDENTNTTFRIETSPSCHKEQNCVKIVSSTVPNVTKLIVLITLTILSLFIGNLFWKSITQEDEIKALHDSIQSLCENHSRRMNELLSNKIQLNIDK